METRSSPSLHVLQGLARQAHIDAQDVSTLSKPALFVHLRSNYDYPQLERAHQTALKRGDGGDADCGCSGGMSMGMGMGSSNKRPCRTGAGGSSSAASFDEEQGLPPASIFVQTRSRTRMQLAAAGAGTGASAEGGSSGQSRPGRVPGGANSTSPCRRSQNRKTSGGRRGAAGAAGGGSASRNKGRSGGGGGGSSGSSSGGGSGSSSGSSSGGDISSSSSSNSSSSSSGGVSGGGGDGGGGGGGSGSVIGGATATEEAEELHTADCVPEDAAARDTSGGAEARKPDVGAETNRTTESTARRKGRRGRRGAAASGRSGRKGKGKGKAKEHSGGVPEGKGRGCEVREDITSGGAVAAGSTSSSTSSSNNNSSSNSSSSNSSSNNSSNIDSNSSNNNNNNNNNNSGKEKEEDRPPPNELDPIMLIKVGKDHHRFVRPNGRVVMYNLDSLVDYFISTGDFLEPETRLPFSDDELRTIDMKAKAAGLSKPSVLEAKQDPRRYAEQKFQQDALVGLERMTSELVTGMLRVVEACDREEGEIRLVTELFPPFADLFKQIWGADKDFASQCMQHYMSWLQGPPNRPTEDEMGFLEIILGFLRQLQECDGNSSLGF